MLQESLFQKEYDDKKRAVMTSSVFWKPMKFIHGKCKHSTLASPVLSGWRPAGKQLGTNRPSGQAEHEPAACSGSNDANSTLDFI